MEQKGLDLNLDFDINMVITLSEESKGKLMNESNRIESN